MTFASRIIAWQREHGRHHLPWQKTRDPYRVWLSEIMLQQTQVSAVVPYYTRFLERFPDVGALAAAPEGAVMACWAGLGYYARARNLHACAQAVVRDFAGRFPVRACELETLPGIGKSTAAAIAAFCSGERAAILDGNVRRVLSRCFAIEGDPAATKTIRQLWSIADSLLPPASTCRRDANAMASYTQGLMDLGATLCLRHAPKCTACPLSTQCIAHQQGRTAELPSARARKASPERQTGVLIALHRRKVLLERRPPNGIWGGLWSLPEFSPELDAQSAAAALGVVFVSHETVAAFAHAFTHFRLILRPVLVRVESHDIPKARGDTLQWFGADELDRIGMPAPIGKLLGALMAAESPRG